ncbi:YcaO-like family protein [Paractinoplanes brasiliensis]|uniref:Ribosomal protein S12 methylthiotransferase accessory factor n=1 Tax=Paractinoplanes brasiliensis TaxID=52695 RepID=A0A4R6JQN9_9ACTN|nr:YcaO-like family protein [Actinoplanes brasiliensis]TDO36945.1 ribosomal protein S12 methylthiotransferase accessory factor [Actinoplanes brasiliensis]GID30467.1 hypothetical protein Abr02nite_54500 [Actinoplanes brasiliensis]
MSGTTGVAEPGLLATLRAGNRIGSLVQPRGGLIGAVQRLPVRPGEAEAEVVAASLGALSRTLPQVTAGDSPGGAGSDRTVEIAWLKAVVEAAERYACIVHDENDFTIASATDLGRAAIDLTGIARCSAREYADPRCPVRPADPDRPIRWVRGVSLIDHTDRFVPAAMVHLHFEPTVDERFWLQTSTGVAAHTSLPAALIAALCEVVERDALALAWLGRLPLDRLAGTPRAEQPERTSQLLARAAGSMVDFHYFDATTDLGVPTVLSVQTRTGHPYCDVTVSCATALDGNSALAKVICEATSARIALDSAQHIPAAVEDFTSLTHGAHYYGRGGQRRAFDFLLDRPATEPPDGWAIRSCLPDLSTASDEHRLAALVAVLRQHGMDVVAVDLTTEELREAGLWVVRVVVPQLMPISFVHRARFLGTPRLTGYVGRTRPGFTESDANPDPLPFA